MATIVFLLRRFFAQRLLGLAIVVTLAFSIGVLVAGPIYADASREAILSSAVRTAAVTVRNVRFATFGGPDFSFEQADAKVVSATSSLPVRQVIRQGLATFRLASGEGVGSAPIQATVRASRNQTARSVPVLFRDGAAEHLDLKGKAPHGPDEIALAAGVAKIFRVKIGDEMQALGPTNVGRLLTLTATYGDVNRSDPFWFGSQTPFPAADSTELPPAVLDRAGFLVVARQLGLTSQFAWDDYLALEGVPFVRAERIPADIAAADDQLRQDPSLGQVRTLTGLPTLLELVRQRVANLRVPIFLVVFQIGAVALAVLAGVGALTLTRQSFELAVLRSRGFSRGKLFAAQAVQAILSSVAAYPLGLLVGMALAKLASESNGESLPGVLFPVRINTVAIILGVVGAIVGAGILLLLSLPHLRRTILEERRLLSRESQPLLARVPVELFVLPVGIFAFVEVRNRGFLSVTQRGSLDPLVLLAPTLLLFAASFLSLRLLLLVLRRFDRALGRVRRLPAYLAGRRLGRSPGTSFATSLLLVLSIGLLVVSTSYRAIVIRNHQDTAHQQIGADWNIQVAAPAQPLAALTGIPSGATPVVRTEPQFQSGSFSVIPIALAIDPSSYEDGGWWREDFSSTPLPEILSKLRTTVHGKEIPAGDDAIELTVTSPPEADGLNVIATLESPDGEVVSTRMGTLDAGTHDYEVSTEGGATLLSIALEEPGVGELPGRITLGIERAEITGASPVPLGLASWEPMSWRASGGSLQQEPAGAVSVTFTPGAGHVIGGITPAQPPLPALVSPGVQSSQGSTFVAVLGGQAFEFRTVAVASAFPSVFGDFLVTSAPALLERAASIPEAGLALNEVWAMGSDPRPGLRDAGFIVGRTGAAGPIEAILSQLPQSLAIGMHFTSAAGGLGLVVIGVAVGLYFAQRRREFEFASLRAMGTEPRQITRVLTLEQGLLIGFAVLAGAGLGFGILRLMMPYVGKSLGFAFPAPVMVIDWRSLGVSGLSVVLATGFGLFMALRALLRSSVTGVLRGEAE